MNSTAIFFYILAAIAVISAISVISARNPVHSALSLVVTLFSLAGIYLMLHAEFLAVIQILTYAGAILVLFIFIIMLLNLKPEELEEKGYSGFSKAVIGLVSLVLFVALGKILLLPKLANEVKSLDFGYAHNVGRFLFSRYLIPFEIAGVLLTVALVGAVLLAKRRLDFGRPKGK